ncbi:hypothetical protein CGCS363_v015034 [Colletotrichum siamense]|uniref:uncharacterized protein n=1 Tax=Colletotrichum siamense TaxID=690259 RepID=UPI0018722079|nr:uncharacterized protein CGCS363_v015190 [Colletotrichum siamense]XP_036487820.1 uncharacterized protein CGCS363_v015113 [Colletotrichum siamense]XP_036487900.1 uncharacterized protein CGCS363_v015034 [Colletotrichum siamense]KAF5482668.1 hypothetical protein CGCS363_v015190 [Colletotrichum siamense]KAF5482957.1 hypothetical protein CGCS363_v015113 [Colletotrichum siamense]KAF5483070.1 hypothetical protein CGCS363_v015034 [Colletotrichum siamense]
MSDAGSPYTGDLRPCGDTCETLQPPGSAWPDDSATSTAGDKAASSDCDPAAGPGRKKLPESQPLDHRDVVGGSGPSAGGPADIPVVRRGLRRAVPHSPPSSGDDAADSPTLGGRPAPPSSSPSLLSSHPLARHHHRGIATSDRASTLPREGHPSGRTSAGKRARATDPPTNDDNTPASSSQARAAAQHASKRRCPTHNPILVSPQTTTRPGDQPAATRDRPHDGQSKNHARDVVSSDEIDDTDHTDYGDGGEDVEDLDCDVSRHDTPDNVAEMSEDCSGNRDDADNKKPPSGEARPHTSEPASSVDKVEAIIRSLVTRGVEQCVALLQAWRAAATSSTLHLPRCESRAVLYRNTQQAKCHEALARYQTRLAYIQLSRRLKKPGPDSAAVYRSRSDIHSLTCEVLGVDPSSADTKSRAFYLQRADISRCLYTGRILDIVSGDGLDFLPVLPAGKLGLTLSDSQDLARRLVSLASGEAEDDEGNTIKQLAAFGRLFARVVQGEQADPLFGLDVEPVARLASAAETPRPPRPTSGPERIAAHTWGLGDKLRASIGRLTGAGQDVSLLRHIDLPHPFVRITYTGTPASMVPRLQAVRHPDVPVLGPLGSTSSPTTNPDQVSITAGDIVSVVPGELILDSSSAASELTPASRWRDIRDEMLLAPPTGSQSSELEAKVLARYPLS